MSNTRRNPHRIVPCERQLVHAISVVEPHLLQHRLEARLSPQRVHQRIHARPGQEDVAIDERALELVQRLRGVPQRGVDAGEPVGTHVAPALHGAQIAINADLDGIETGEAALAGVSLIGENDLPIQRIVTWHSSAPAVATVEAIDLEVTVCVKPGHLPSDVRDRVLLLLRGDGVTPGYFNPDSFTFGMPIHRLTLEAVIGAVPGVLAVRSITIAARGHHLRRPLEPVYRVPDNQILRLANDPRTPERGSVKVFTEGGV